MPTQTDSGRSGSVHLSTTSAAVGLERMADREMTQRSRVGVVAYPAAALLLAAVSPIGREWPGLAFSLTAVVLAAAVVRGLLVWRGDALYRRNQQRWRVVFITTLLVTTLAWSLLSAALVLLYGLREFGFVGLVCAGAIASAGLAVYRSHLWLMRAHTLAIVVPNLVACVLEGSTASLGLSAAIAGIYLPFLWLEGRLGYDEYRAGLRARIEADARAEQLRRSEESYRDLVDKARVAIAVDDAHGQLVYFNTRFGQLLGCGPEESSDRAFERLIHPDDLQRYRQARAALAEPGTETQRLELRGVPQEGRPVVFELAAEPLLEEGLLIGARWYLWDVTDRVAAEQERSRLFAELVASRSEFEAIVERSREGMVVLADGGRVSFANRAARALLPDLDRVLAEGDLRAATANDAGFCEVPIARPDGLPGTAEVRLQPTEWQGVPAELVLFRDVTERRQAERALRASEQRFRDLFERNLAGVYRSNLDGQLLDCNDAFARIYGFPSREAALARPAVELYTNPLEREAFLAELERTGWLTAFESRGRRLDGSTIWLLENVVLLPDDEGRPTVIQGTILDVTESRRTTEALRRSEERLALILRTVPVAVYTGEVPSEIDATWISDSAERLTGYPARRHVEEPRFWKTRLHPQDRERVEGEFSQLATGQRTELGVEYRWLVASNSYRWFFERAVATGKGTDGKVHVMGIFLDITERRELESQLAQAQKMEAVGRLAGGIAHDFNNLLQTMLAEIAMARRSAGDDPAQLQRAVDRLEDQVRRSASLTRQLLLFSRRQEAERRVFDLNTVVAENGRMLRGWIPPTVRLDLSPSPDPAWVNGSAVELGQVVLNLALNACDAMPAGGRLEITTGLTGDDQIALEVRDTGAGIPEEIRERIFEPFFSTKGKDQGTGLGLAVVHGIVSSHGGRVDMTTEVGSGTVFRVVLPRAPESSPDVPPEAHGEVTSGRGERILLVEDHETLRETLSQLLTASGYLVLTASSAEEARALADAQTFDLLLSDVMLPGATGSDLLTSLRQRWPDLPVILMSGYAESHVVRPVLGSGALRFLEKPISLDRLTEEIRSALHRAAAGPAPTPVQARIVVVEDQRPLRDMMVSVLRGLGHEVTGVDRAEAALERLERTGPQVDLIVSDLSLPGMDGDELLRRSRALPNPPAFVVCTGAAPAEGLLGDHDDVRYVGKPFELEELERVVGELLARRRG